MDEHLAERNGSVLKADCEAPQHPLKHASGSKMGGGFLALPFACTLFSTRPRTGTAQPMLTECSPRDVSDDSCVRRPITWPDKKQVSRRGSALSERAKTNTSFVSGGVRVIQYRVLSKDRIQHMGRSSVGRNQGDELREQPWPDMLTGRDE